MKRLSLIIIFLLLCVAGFAQLVLVPLPKDPAAKKTVNNRTKNIEPLILPFWDDFSTIRNGYADEKRWLYGNSVWVNQGMGINAPSLNVATFDGLDSLGRPYNVNDILAKGLADKLVSAPLRMDLITGTDRTRVFLSFFYQYFGNGEAPDIGDYIQLLFKNNTGSWEVVWTKENDGTLSRDIFEQVTIPISAERFFHETFQFQFRNFARLSGPYDTWHLDYVYVSNGKQQSAPVRPLFPDRAITSPITSPFAAYSSMPLKHFYSNLSGNAINPSIVITNLRQDQVAGNGQPVSYSTVASVSVNKKEQPPVIANIPLDLNRNIGTALNYNDRREVLFNTIPDWNSFDKTADSIHIKLGIVFDTGDNKIKTATEGDYDFNVFNPIEFRHNDSISISFNLVNYYAYDDGTAEYGAGLNQPGAQLAYEFNMKYNEPDTIVALDVYFPRFGDESNQIVEFQIRKALTDNPSDILYKINLPIQRNLQNRFWRITLVDQPTGVKDKFYLGWKQNSSAIIAVGLDKNTDTGSKIYANINGAWEQNTSLKGSLMIRPVFGKGKGNGEVTGINEAISFSIFPNPSKGTFTIKGNPTVVNVYDMTGRKMDYIMETEEGGKRISLTNAAPGLYIVGMLKANQWHTQKVLIEN